MRVQLVVAVVIVAMLLIVSLTSVYVHLIRPLTDCPDSNRMGLDQFKWPPFVDVRAEVERQLAGEPPQSYIANNWSDFHVLIVPNCTGWTTNERTTNNSDTEILIIIKSAPNRMAQRDAIRATFGAYTGDEAGGFRMRTVFVMGSMLRWRTDWMARLRAEARQHGDLLVGEHEDDYFRSCFKFANSIKLARRFCQRDRAVSYLMLLDDDYVMFPWELVKEVQRHTPTERLYTGFCYYGSQPYRNTDEKWAVTNREYPFNEYPPYCCGGTILFSQKIVEEFYLAIQHVEFFVWEDVYAGFLAHFLNIPVQHNPKFWGRDYRAEPTIWHCVINADYPRCKNWRDVISAHGYKPAEIQDLYPRMKTIWDEQKQQQQHTDITNNGNVTITDASRWNTFGTTAESMETPEFAR